MNEPKTAQQHNAQLTGVAEDLPYERHVIAEAVVKYDRDRMLKELDHDLEKLVPDPIFRQAIVAQVVKTLVL